PAGCGAGEKESIMRSVGKMVGLFLALMLHPAVGAELNASAINAAQRSGKALSDGKPTPLGVRLQVLLDRARFSPGEIDGRFGENARKALHAFQEAQQLPQSDKVTDQTWGKRAAASDLPVMTEYTITTAAVAGPFLHKLPTKMEAMKDLPKLSYTSPREELAEKFHMSEDLLKALNPDGHFDRAGEKITVVNFNGDQNRAKADRIEVDKNRQIVKVFDKSN